MIGRLALLCVALFLALATFAGGSSGIATADTNSQVINWLAAHDTYITDVKIPGQNVSQSDIGKLDALVAGASKRQVSEKLAILSHYPYPHYGDIHAAADAMFNALNYSGVIILISPPFTVKGHAAYGGIGVSSDQMSRAEELKIEARAAPKCRTQGYLTCLTYASSLAVTQVRQNKSSAFHDAAVFWIVILVGFGVLVLILILVLARRRTRETQNLEALRQAASSTLSVADNAVQTIEQNAASLSPEARQEYDRGLGLRDRARREIEGAHTYGGLRQANEDAAQAVLAMKGTMRAAGIQGPLTDPLDLPEHRCFYCGRTDRPPYTTRTIDDGRGNSMEVEICAVDMQRLQQGRTPQIATAQYQGAQVPWWAVPGSPWYYTYGGPSWQYWLPFLIGMDVGGWFGGGWGGFYGGPTVIENNYFDGGGGDPGQGQGADMGAGDFTGWLGPDQGGADPGSTGDWGSDTSGWGGDVGAGDWGGDVGSGDIGGGDWGGDSGGGDWGGGDSGGW